MSLSGIGLWLHKAEQLFLTLLFFAMLVVAVAQIVLRNFFDSGLLWGDSFIQVVVLWIGFAGAAYATRQGEHINIDIASKFLPQALASPLYRLVNGVALLVCAIAAYHSYRLVLLEKEDPVIAFLNVPTWVCELIIPIVFAVMAWRFLLLALKGYQDPNALSQTPSNPEPSQAQEH